jgi:pimeloyl-[acyl-carrier protein] methyl ester esterase
MEWSAQASGGEFHLIAHAGHAPFLSHAQAVAQALLPWLETHA